ncbi:hypothetical protein IAT38_000415 [Cryptococcus sp. DSM 104549]
MPRQSPVGGSGIMTPLTLPESSIPDPRYLESEQFLRVMRARPPPVVRNHSEPILSSLRGPAHTPQTYHSLPTPPGQTPTSVPASRGPSTPSTPLHTIGILETDPSPPENDGTGDRFPTIPLKRREALRRPRGQDSAEGYRTPEGDARWPGWPYTLSPVSALEHLTAEFEAASPPRTFRAFDRGAVCSPSSPSPIVPRRESPLVPGAMSFKKSGMQEAMMRRARAKTLGDVKARDMSEGIYSPIQRASVSATDMYLHAIEEEPTDTATTPRKYPLRPYPGPIQPTQHRSATFPCGSPEKPSQTVAASGDAAGSPRSTGSGETVVWEVESEEEWEWDAVLERLEGEGYA